MGSIRYFRHLTVTDPFRDDYAYLTELPEELKYRRREAARRRRWRRRLVLAAVVAVIAAAAVLAVIGILGWPGDEQAATSPTAQAQATTPAYSASWAPLVGKLRSAGAA